MINFIYHSEYLSNVVQRKFHWLCSCGEECELDFFSWSLQQCQRYLANHSLLLNIPPEGDIHLFLSNLGLLANNIAMSNFSVKASLILPRASKMESQIPWWTTGLPQTHFGKRQSEETALEPAIQPLSKQIHLQNTYSWQMNYPGVHPARPTWLLGLPGV